MAEKPVFISIIDKDVNLKEQSFDNRKKSRNR
jgi:hypothetical protein